MLFAFDLEYNSIQQEAFRSYYNNQTEYDGFPAKDYVQIRENTHWKIATEFRNIWPIKSLSVLKNKSNVDQPHPPFKNGLNQNGFCDT